MEVLLIIAGEIIGEGGLFFSIMHKGHKESKYTGRELFLMPVLSVALSVVIISIILGISKLGKEIFGLLYSYGYPLYLLRDLVKAICKSDIFSMASYVFLYAYFYSLCRSGISGKLVQWAREILEEHEELGGVYVKNSFGIGYVLSEKWENIRQNLYYIICADVLIMAAMRIFDLSERNSIIDVKLIDMLPIAILVLFLETARYLSADEKRGWMLRLLKRRKQAADCELNVIHLEGKIAEYSINNGMSVLQRKSRHQYNTSVTTDELIGEYRKDGDDKIQYLLDYIEQKRTDYFIPLHSIDVAVRLVRGENLFVANSFYQDLDVCIFFPAYLALLKGEKVLLLAEDMGNLDDIAEWIREGIEDIQQMMGLWTVDILSRATDDADVGILAFQEVCKQEQLQWCRRFLNEVSFVVIIEASGLLTAGQDVVAAFSEKVGRKRNSTTWLLCDSNAESMIDLYSHLLEKEFLYVSATPYCAKEALAVYWNTEEEPLKAFPYIQRYLGVESCIVQIAERESVRRVRWYGENIMPVYDMLWMWGQYYRSYPTRPNNTVPYQMFLDRNVEIAVSGRENAVKEQQFIMTEDECFHLFEKGRQYTTRAFDKVCVCVLSPNYMLRDYMRDNFLTMEKDPKYIVQYMPEHVDSERNIALRMIRMLLEAPVSRFDLERVLSKEEGNNKKIEITERLLKEKIKLIFPEIEDADIELSYEDQFSRSVHRIQHMEFYYLIDKKVREEMRRYFNQAFYIDESGKAKYISKLVLAGHLDQKYAKGQFVVFSGKYYEIIGKTDGPEGPALQVKRASDQLICRRYYRMVRKYELRMPYGELPTAGTVSANRAIYIKNGYYEILWETADITACTVGYVELLSWENIAKGKKICFSEENIEKREYRHKQMLKVRWVKELANKGAPIYMAALLKEMFCTLYPHFYHLLDVAVNHRAYQRVLKRNREWEYVVSDIRISADKKMLVTSSQDQCFYIIEDSREDMGLLRSIERNIHKIFKILEDYIKWSYDNGVDYLTYGK